MDKNEIHKKILEDEDYIRCPKHNNSITKFLSKNPKGVDSAAIGRLLMIPEEKVDEIYDEAVEILKKEMEEKE